MDDVQIRLATMWVALMLTYLLGDVLRIFAGDFKAGEIGGMPVPDRGRAWDQRAHHLDRVELGRAMAQAEGPRRRQ